MNAAPGDRVAAFVRLIGQTPADPVLRFGLGNALYAAGRFEEAAGAYREAVRLDPAYSAAHKQLGRALLKAERGPEAKTAFAEGLAVARSKGDLQTVREIETWLKQLG